MSRPNAAPAHTPEPWRARGEAVGRNYERHGTAFEVLATSGTFVAKVGPLGIDSQPTAEANAVRIVACVNALAGVADPAAVRALVEAARAAVEHSEANGRRLLSIVEIPDNPRHVRAVATLGFKHEEASRAALRAALAAFPEVAK